MTPPTELMHKLQLKSGDRLWLINVPATIAEELAAGAEVEIVGRGEACDGVLIYFNTAQEVATLLPEILAATGGDSLLWTAFRTDETGKDAGLTQDAGWEPLHAAGWTIVQSVALGDGWSALLWQPKDGAGD